MNRYPALFQQLTIADHKTNWVMDEPMCITRIIDDKLIYDARDQRCERMWYGLNWINIIIGS
jgi:hypothetical protein